MNKSDPMTIRIIPAYAGSTTFAPAIPVSRSGSSPHTRGALGARRPGPRPPRIIPAYAGSTVRRAYRRHPGADHPRIRGEHTRSHAQRGWGGGSSPHTRGARRLGVGRRQNGGIIPAYAGSTRPPPAYADTTPDHPRIRGEHLNTRMLSPGGVGSSPHTRGAPDHDVSLALEIGIIPAYAGSTPGRGGATGPHRDHPRIRGEHETDTTTSRLRAGSSPHTRGARVGVEVVGEGTGIIPAYAGSTSLW